MEINYNKNKYMMTPDVYYPNKQKIDYIELNVTKKLKDYPNFDYLDFSYTYDNKIHIRCFHKQIKCYNYGNHIEIELNDNDYKECVDVIVEMWKEFDVPDKVKSFLRFIKDGETYGWD